MYYERFYWLDKSSNLLNSFIFEICLDYRNDGVRVFNYLLNLLIQIVSITCFHIYKAYLPV